MGRGRRTRKSHVNGVGSTMSKRAKRQHRRFVRNAPQPTSWARESLCLHQKTRGFPRFFHICLVVENTNLCCKKARKTAFLHKVCTKSAQTTVHNIHLLLKYPLAPGGAGRCSFHCCTWWRRWHCCPKFCLLAHCTLLDYNPQNRGVDQFCPTDIIHLPSNQDKK